MINDNVQILATLGSALTVYIFIRIGAHREAKEIKSELNEMKKDLKSIDMRLTRLEGRFEERGYWESRIIRKTGTEAEEN